MAERRANFYIERLKNLEARKRPWLSHFQTLGEIFNTRKADFTNVSSPGEFLQDAIFDNTPQFAAFLFSSVMNSMLWPDAARTFQLVPSRPLRGLPGVDDYFRAKTEVMHEAMDNSDANLQQALMEHLLDEGVFGTAGLGTFEGPDDDMSLPVRYESWDVKAMFITEGARGFVDTIYWREKRTVRQVFQEYGVGKRPRDRISSVVAEKAKSKNGLDDQIEVLKVLEPKTPEKNKHGFAAMPYRGVHIDVDNKVVMREEGFNEQPVHVARIFKKSGEEYGRSPGMTALPDALSLNALTESTLVAAEKNLDPPLAVLDDGRLGGQVIDTSASAINVFNTSGRPANEKPIFPIQTVGEMNSAEKHIERLAQFVMQAFFLDRLLDLNNKTVMTAFETSIRNRLRGEATGSVFARVIAETLNPMIRRTYNILFRRGYFGEFEDVSEDGAGAERRRRWKEITGKDPMRVPPPVRKAYEADLDVYEIEYISPARRFMQAEKLQGLFTAQDVVAALDPIYPGLKHSVDPRVLMEQIYKFAGAPIESLRSRDEYKKALAEEAQRQNLQQAVALGKDAATIQRDSALARQALGTKSANGA